MSELENSVPAGTEAAPASVEAEANREPETRQSLSLEEAANRWADAQEKTTPAQPDPVANSEPPATSADAEPAGAAEAKVDGNGEPAEAGKPNAPDGDGQAPIEIDRLHGNTKVRLRDGTEWTGAEVKRRLEDLRTLDTQRTNFETLVREKAPELQRLAEREAALAQREKLYAEHLEPAINALREAPPEVPPMPDVSLMSQDFMEYNRQLHAHQAGRAEHEAWQQRMYVLNQEHQQRQRQAYEQQQQQIRAAQQQSYEYLLSKRPELSDPNKVAEFRELLIGTGKSFGFNEDEIRFDADPRWLHMVASLAASDRELKALKANPPKPVKPQAENTAPVAQPGRRVDPTSEKAQTRDAVLARAKTKPGGLSVDDAAAIALKLGL